jgi:predicted RNA-binding Zn-ribbon protein involved in translation (DUF1610 family)
MTGYGAIQPSIRQRSNAYLCPICDVRSCAADRLQGPLLDYSPKAISDVLEAKAATAFLSFKGKPVPLVSIQTLPRIPADEYTAWDIPACGRKEAVRSHS